MIWRRPRPTRGFVAALLVLLLGATVGSFGIGLPELALLLALASVAFLVASRDGSPA